MPNRQIKRITASLTGAESAETFDISDELAVHTADIVDNLTTADSTKVLSANQGSVINGYLSGLTSVDSYQVSVGLYSPFTRNGMLNFYKTGAIVFVRGSVYPSETLNRSSKYVLVAADILPYPLRTFIGGLFTSYSDGSSGEISTDNFNICVTPTQGPVSSGTYMTVFGVYLTDM